MKPHVWLIRVIGVIVPRRLRTDWRLEWESELRCRELLLEEWDRLDWGRKLDLLWRNTSAFWDALWLQTYRWEDDMIQDLRYGLGERFVAQLGSFFSVCALLLASIGLYGVMSYATARRTQEIGIRMALGAQASDVVRLVMRETILMVVAGVTIGLGAAVAATRLVDSLLFGLTATDPITISLAVLLLLAVATLAGYLPARRASRVDPLAALRYE